MVKHLFLALSCMLGALSSHAQYLDSTFGTYGIVSTSFAGTAERCSTVLVQPDKKILAGGYTTSTNGFKEFVIARYDTTGVLDNSFGTAGKVVMPNGGTNNELKNMALQPDGKILAAGIAMSGSFSPWSTLLVRYNTNGTPDNTFGTNGKVTTQVGTKCDAYDIVVQPDGKILICGTQYDDNFYIIIRYNANGTLDNSFGTNGVMQATDFGTGVAITVQPDGKILVTGEFWGTNTLGGPHIGVARHNANGTIDNTFGTNGQTIIISPYPGEYLWGAHDIKLLPDGRILIPIYLSSSMHAHEPCIVRFSSSGMLDNTFGNNGFATGSFCNFYEGGEKLAVQPDGKILLVGYINPESNSDRDSLFVMRFDTSGAPDATFGIDGRITAKFDTGGCAARTIALQSDGKFVVGGTTQLYAANKFMVARYRYFTPIVSVENTPSVSQVEIYPNPATDAISVKLGNAKTASADVIDMVGRMLYTKIISQSDNKINVKTLPPGNYIISLSVGKETFTRHFEKQ